MEATQTLSKGQQATGTIEVGPLADPAKERDVMPQPLTATQARVLANLRRDGRVFARTPRLQGSTGGTATRPTLQSLVDLGHARWETAVRGGYVLDCVVPLEGIENAEIAR